MLDDILVFLVFQSLLIVFFVHGIEVVVTGENDGLFIRRNRGPSRPVLGFLVVFKKCEFTGDDIVLEIEDFFLGFFFFLWSLFFLFFLFFFYLFLFFLHFFFLFRLFLFFL